MRKSHLVLEPVNKNWTTLLQETKEQVFWQVQSPTAKQTGIKCDAMKSSKWSLVSHKVRVWWEVKCTANHTLLHLAFSCHHVIPLPFIATRIVTELVRRLYAWRKRVKKLQVDLSHHCTKASIVMVLSWWEIIREWPYSKPPKLHLELVVGRNEVQNA